MTRVIYLDNASSTRVAPEVAKVALSCMTEDYGNPSSAHHLGIGAEKRVKEARAHLLRALGDPEGRLGDVVWTSGGTEGDALGVAGAARARAKRARRVVLSAIEHPAVRESAALLAEEGFEIALVPVSSDGVVDIDRALAEVDSDTAVCALMLVNNEIGTVQPVAELARAIRERHPRVHVHTDAVQALGKIPIDVGSLGVDSAAFAAHKIHGPKGVGALWVKKKARIRPLFAGGGQQGGLRAGTLNVPGIAALGEAVRLAATEQKERAAREARLGGLLREAVAGCGVEVRENGAAAPRASHVLSFAFRGVPAEPLLHVLESRGVLVSAGSACAERDRKPSPVLEAIGLGPEFGTLRFSFGRETTEEDVRTAGEILVEAVRSFA